MTEITQPKQNQHAKITSQDYGYPTILLDEDVRTRQIDNYSSAKYKNGILISKRGNCPYPQKLFFDVDNQYYTYVDKQHHVVHLATKINDQLVVVVSNRMLQWNNYLMWFPYIFMLFQSITFLFFSMWKSGAFYAKIPFTFCFL